MILAHGEKREAGYPMHVIGELLLASRANITGLVDSLEKKGLVRRQEDPDDRRSKLVRITPQGDRLLKKILPGHLRAVHRVAASDTAFSCRDANWSMVICGIDPRPEKAPLLRKWGREYWQAVHPYNAAGAYVNFMMDDEAEGRVRATYASNYPALVELKRKLDPANCFRINQNISPGDDAGVSA